MAKTDFYSSLDRNYIKNELSEMITQICLEKGLSFVISKSSYSHESMKITLELSNKEESVAVSNPYLHYELAWKKQHSRYFTLGLQNDWLGKKFQFGATQYTIIGLSQRKSKWPIIAANRFGDLRKFSITSISMKTFI